MTLSRDRISIIGDRTAELLDAQREQRELTALIVHDLKAPLSALYAGLEWMRAHLWPAS